VIAITDSLRSALTRISVLDHTISVASVAHLLDGKARRRKQPPPLDVVVPESVRHVRVTPHALSDYDSLAKNDGES
jgi:hypothetical protein